METLGGHPVLKSFLVGSFSGTFSTILFQPLDLIKTRLQNRVSNHVEYQRSSMMTTVITIVRKENIFGLWKGITPSITRVIPGVGLYFSTLYWLKSTLALNEPLTPFQAITLGITARTISGVILIPITVIKTRYESGMYKYNSIGEALKLIHKNEGIKGLSSGLVPTLLRDAPYSGLYLMFYTELKKLASNELPHYNNMFTINFGCGVTAGILASVVTHPADVLKTKMQLYPGRYKNLRSTFLFMYSQFGILGYFRGIVPRMIRRTLMTAMAWTVYEQITVSVGLK